MGGTSAPLKVVDKELESFKSELILFARWFSSNAAAEVGIETSERSEYTSVDGLMVSWMRFQGQ